MDFHYKIVLFLFFFVGGIYMIYNVPNPTSILNTFIHNTFLQWTKYKIAHTFNTCIKSVKLSTQKITQPEQ